MRYVSTRGGPSCGFEEGVRQGLAPDGGLYVPEKFPVFSVDELRAMQPLSYTELAVRVMKDFVAPDLSPGELAALVQESYSGFSSPDVTPLRKLDDGLFLLELFRGPTLAFKDIALQFLGRVFGHYAHKRGSTLTVLGATSGDTGSAAIAGCRGIKGIRVFILYPHKRPSELQRRQMTCVDAPNVHVLAVQGTFDDCQALVKRAFQDPELKKKCELTAVNSINWARIIAQSVYYFYAGLRAGALEKPVNFVVPSGNFGNIYAGYVAKRLGLPINKLIAATNRNDSLAKFIQTGFLQPGPVVPSLSPSMDIQIPSNLERYLFELLDRNAEALKTALQEGGKISGYRLPLEALKKMQEDFMAERADDRTTKDTMRDMHTIMNVLADPHTAVGLYAATKVYGSLPGAIVALACADPAKFPDTVKAATRQTPAVPKSLENLEKKRERFTIIPNSDQALRGFILNHT